VSAWGYHRHDHMGVSPNEQSPTERPDDRLGYVGWLLFGMRYVLPVAVALGGAIVMMFGSESDLEGGAGIVSAGLAIYAMNWLYRASVDGDRAREQEEAARIYLDTHGHWPDELPPRGAGAGAGARHRHYAAMEHAAFAFGAGDDDDDEASPSSSTPADTSTPASAAPSAAASTTPPASARGPRLKPGSAGSRGLPAARWPRAADRPCTTSTAPSVRRRRPGTDR
jgi:hypothetical protein